MQGLILFAHGARDPRWAAPFDAVAAALRASRPSWRVACAYLELMPPALPDAAAQLLHEGCTRLAVLPMFLGAGGHVRHDLPRLLEPLRQAHPALPVVLLPPIGEQPEVLAAMARTAQAMVEGAGA